MRKLLGVLLVTFTAVLSAAPARAQFNAFDNTTAPGLQNYGNSLGLDFDVLQPITVTRLAAFDNGDPANLNFQDPVNGVTVAIYNRNTQTQVGPSQNFTTADPGERVNANVFKDVADFDLPVGNYSLVAFNAPNYNSSGGDNTFNTTNNGGGLISFVGGGRFGSDNAFPGGVDGGPADRYNIGSFEFVAVPEPTALGLLALGGLALLCRRQK